MPIWSDEKWYRPKHWLHRNPLCLPGTQEDHSRQTQEPPEKMWLIEKDCWWQARWSSLVLMVRIMVAGQGAGVNLKAEKEDPEKKKLIDKGWKDNAYNQWGMGMVMMGWSWAHQTIMIKQVIFYGYQPGMRVIWSPYIDLCLTIATHGARRRWLFLPSLSDPSLGKFADHHPRSQGPPPASILLATHLCDRVLPQRGMECSDEDHTFHT